MSLHVGDDVGYRALAAAVIWQAMRDLTGPADYGGGSARSAQRFLQSGDPWLRFWCDVAGCDAQYVVGRVTRRPTEDQ